jgi:hypothetical protein
MERKLLAHRSMRRLTLAWLLPLACLSACGDEKPAILTLSVTAEWAPSPAAPNDLGHLIKVDLQETLSNGSCRGWSSSTRVTVNGQMFPYDPASSPCLHGELVLGPFSTDQMVTVRLEEDGDTVAVGEFAGLLPGTGARLVSPAGGRARPGDEIVISPVVELLGLPAPAVFYPLEAIPFDADGMSASVDRVPDGLRAHVPSFTGPAVVKMFVAPEINYGATISCTGMWHCRGLYSLTLGPVAIDVQP